LSDIKNKLNLNLNPSLRIGGKTAMTCCYNKIGMNDGTTTADFEMNNPLPSVRISSMATNDPVNTPW